MNIVEEKLWAYIDGFCTDEEHQAITKLIYEDDTYCAKYNELLKLDNEFAAIKLDEPPMSFTYQVLEAIRTENASKPLKSSIDKRIIWSIAAFFTITITAIVIFALSNINYHASLTAKLPSQLNIKHMASYFSGPLIKGFLFFDMVIGLFLLDHSLRKKQMINEL